jgi:transketolase
MKTERRAGVTSNVSLEQRAWNIRRKTLLMGEVQGQGYIGQAWESPMY